MDPTGSFARRFPLVARPRPACRPLLERVADLRDRATRAEAANDLAAASSVHNLAALVASDCGLPDLARQWCRDHAQLYLRTHPLNADTARHALEPLVNLARLHIRDGNGTRAHHLIETLYTAVTNRTDTTIEGVDLPRDLVPPGRPHQDLRRWLWTVLLATSARALAVTGHWQDALTHLHNHHGIGHRMLDGRQIAVIAHATRGDTPTALDLLADTKPGEPWENAVTASLTLHCQGSNTASLDQLLDRFYQLTTPTVAVFHTQLGLTFLDTLNPDHPHAHRVATDLIHRALSTRDGYLARDILRHTVCRAYLANAHSRILATYIDSCALDRAAIPMELFTTITAARASASETISRILALTR